MKQIFSPDSIDAKGRGFISMKIKVVSGLIVATTFAFSPIQGFADPSGSLDDHGIAPGRAAQVLPGNAIVHAKIRNLQAVLEQAEELLLNTVPEKVLPPAILPVFNAERPLLTLLGMPLLQAPLTSEALAARIGFDSESEITLTLYPGDPSKFFIASIGMADPKKLTEALNMFLQPEHMSETSIGGRRMLQIQSQRTPMGSLFISCSEDRAYITGEPSLLIHLHEPGVVPVIAHDPHLGATMNRIKKKDIAITINPSLIKPITEQIPFYKYLPLSFLSQARTQFLQQMPEQQRKAIEKQIEQQTGIKDLETILDYAECFIAATYEHVFDTVLENIDGFNGTTLAIRFNHKFPEFSFYLHHDNIEVARDTKAIPLAAVDKALRRIGPESNSLRVSGRQATAEPSIWVSEWIEKTRSLVEKKGLDTAVIDTIQSLHQTTERPDPLESKVPWTIEVAADVNPAPPLSSFNSIQEFITDRQSRIFEKSSRTVTIVPGRSSQFLGEHLRSNIAAQEANQTLGQSVFGKATKPSLIFKEQRLNETSLPGNVTQFTLENAFISRAGFFGYNQHEFINRKIYFARPTLDYLVFHQASTDATWLRSLGSDRNKSERASMQHLVERVPSDANFFSAFRGLDKVMDGIHWIQDAEALLHRDIESYLKKVELAAESTDNRESLLEAIESLPFSPAVAALNQDASGKFYCLLPGNITFPRQRVTTILGSLFEGFEASTTNEGGVIAYTRTFDGTKEWTFSWNTEGLSSLVRSVGNAVAERFLQNPSGIQEAMQMVMSPRDMDPKRFDEVLAKNPAWQFLEQVKLPTGRPQFSRPKTAATPQSPIPPRSEEAPETSVDLSPFFNGSLTETWHQGGITGNDLAALPRGLSTIGGVAYDLRGVIQLTGGGAEKALSVTFPAEVQGIKVNQSAAQIHFLHGCGWNDGEGSPIGTYIIRYQDGTTVEIPIEYGIHMRDWWTPTSQAEVPSGDIAWIGSNSAAASQDKTIQLYHLAWKNPNPEKTIAAIDFNSARGESAPFLLAITID